MTHKDLDIVNNRLSASVMTFLMGYASVLNLHPILANPAYVGAALGQPDDDFLPVGLDWSQVNEDTKIAFGRLAHETEGELQPA
ncbi:MAG TPA: hypothetical protein VGA37_11145 [Gemmatimonadales bacterium]